MRKNAIKYVEITCVGCGNKSLKQEKEINRQINKGRSNFYCSRLCAGKKAHKIKHKEIKSNCLFCNSEFITSTRPKAARTCSISCATKLGLSRMSEESKFIKSNKLKLNGHRRSYKEPVILVCKCCNNNFLSKKKNRKTCSNECYIINLRNQARLNPNCGGETNYKRYTYKEITMDSSWEVELAQWLDENNIKWIRSRKICLFWKDENNQLRRYYPDFYLPDYNLYLDPKNKYLQEKDKYKLNSVRKEQNVVIFSGYLDDIKSKIKDLCD